MRILWLKTELLHPVDKGGKIRTYQMLRELKREHRVTYLTLDGGGAPPDARARADEYCHELITIPHATRRKFSAGFYAELAANLVSPLPYFMKKYESEGMRREIARRAATSTCWSATSSCRASTCRARSTRPPCSSSTTSRR